MSIPTPHPPHHLVLLRHPLHQWQDFACQEALCQTRRRYVAGLVSRSDTSSLLVNVRSTRRRCWRQPRSTNERTDSRLISTWLIQSGCVAMRSLCIRFSLELYRGVIRFFGEDGSPRVRFDCSSDLTLSTAQIVIMSDT